MKVEVELGARTYSEKLKDFNQACAFIHAIIKDEPLRWKSATEATAKGGVMIIRAKGLEDLVEAKPSSDHVLTDEHKKKIKAFLGGNWKTETPKKVEPKKSKSGPVGLTPLVEICERLKITTRAARVKLRAMKLKKPASGMWAWPSAEAKKVETKLKESLNASA